MEDTALVERINDHIKKVQTLSSDYLGRLNSAFVAAQHDFVKLHSSMMRLYNARDYANNMHVHLRDQIKKHFADVPEAYFDDKSNRSFKLLIDGNVKGVDVFLAFILKKQGRGYRTANIKTKTVKEYSQQIIDYLTFEPIFQNLLFDIKGSGKTSTVINVPNCANLVAGYQIDPTWASFNQLAVTMPFSFRKIILLHDFTNVPAETAADIVDMSQPEIQKPPRVTRRSVATPKRDNVRKFSELSTSDVAEDADIRKLNERNS